MELSKVERAALTKAATSPVNGEAAIRYLAGGTAPNGHVGTGVNYPATKVAFIRTIIPTIPHAPTSEWAASLTYPPELESLKVPASKVVATVVHHLSKAAPAPKPAKATTPKTTSKGSAMSEARIAQMIADSQAATIAAVLEALGKAGQS